MLDKSVQYYELFMRRSPDVPLPDAPLPGGFRFALYREGDEQDWAEIETSVAEFDSVADAHAYFLKNFAPFRADCAERVIFVLSADGEKVATATAWYDDASGKRIPWLHWVSVKPAFQNLGLGKAVVREAVRRSLLLDGARAMVLHTQTWSHKAIEIYKKLGFEIAFEPVIGVCQNADVEKAVAVLDAIDRAGCKP